MKKKVSTSKIIVTYLFTILNIVLVYAMVAMWYFGDLTYLGALITDVGGQVLTFAIYAAKSKAENTEGGITYEMAMRSLDIEDDEEPDREGAMG